MNNEKSPARGAPGFRSWENISGPGAGTENVRALSCRRPTSIATPVAWGADWSRAGKSRIDRRQQNTVCTQFAALPRPNNDAIETFAGYFRD